uniref:Uncharacterized protein n=1 Tax=Fagus sylvatica TaxID=28930 RepID=A0A2N9FFM5_FAGSY
MRPQAAVQIKNATLRSFNPLFLDQDRCIAAAPKWGWPGFTILGEEIRCDSAPKIRSRNYANGLETKVKPRVTLTQTEPRPTQQYGNAGDAEREETSAEETEAHNDMITVGGDGGGRNGSGLSDDDSERHGRVAPICLVRVDASLCTHAGAVS